MRLVELGQIHGNGCPFTTRIIRTRILPGQPQTTRHIRITKISIRSQLHKSPHHYP